MMTDIYKQDAERKLNKAKADKLDLLFDTVIDTYLDVLPPDDCIKKYMDISKKVMTKYPHKFAQAFAPLDQKYKSEYFIKEAIQEDHVVKKLTPEQQARADSVRYVGQEKPRKNKNIESDEDWFEITSKGKN